MSRRRSESSNKIFILVFSIAFGLLALALGYQAVMNSSDIRSRAAITEQIYKQWEFTSGTTEGWMTLGTVNAVVKNGNLVITQKNALQPTSFINNSVGVSIPKGLKTVSLSMAVGQVVLPTITPSDTKKPINVQEVNRKAKDVLFQQAVQQNIACPQNIRTCQDGSYTSRAGERCAFLPCPTSQVRRFTGQLYYRLANKRTYEKPMEFYGSADGKFQVNTITLPNIDAVGIEQMRFIMTSGVKISDTIAIDWIRVSGSPLKETPTPKVSAIPTSTCIPRPPCMDAPLGQPRCLPAEPINGTYCPKTSTPTPSVTCKTGVTSFSVDTECPGGFQYMTFKCYDGFGRREGGPSSCKSSETWSSYAQQYCAGHSNCPVTSSTPILTPSTSCKPMPCAVPPFGCYYQGSTSCSCGTLVCQSTPTPTSSATTTCLREDINNDGVVNSTDVLIVKQDMDNPIATNVKSDVDKNGKVDIFDYNIVYSRLNQSTGPCSP